MGIEITPLPGTTFGAEIGGVDVTRLDNETWTQIEAAFHQYGIVIFHGQVLTRDDQIEFGRRFGELQINDTGGLRPEIDGKPIVLNIANVDDDGVHQPDRRHPLNRFNAGNEGWHSDSSFQARTAAASILYAMEVPTSGGDTGFADMRAAYDALTDEEKRDFGGRLAYHSLQYSQAVSGSVDLDVPDWPTDLPGAWHPVARTHPATGRPSLFVSRHACQLSGTSVADGQARLARLLQEACQPPRVYWHRWTPGDIVVWDNRCMLHRATDYDLRERRVLRHVRIAGELDPVAVEAAAADFDGEPTDA